MMLLAHLKTSAPSIFTCQTIFSNSKRCVPRKFLMAGMACDDDDDDHVKKYCRENYRHHHHHQHHDHPENVDHLDIDDDDDDDDEGVS